MAQVPLTGRAVEEQTAREFRPFRRAGASAPLRRAWDQRRGSPPQASASLKPDLWRTLPAAVPQGDMSGALGLAGPSVISAEARISALRTEVRHMAQVKSLRRIAIASPRKRCGASFVAIKLAQSLARVPGSRIALLDFNLRQPGLAQGLGLAPTLSSAALAAVLAGERPMLATMCRQEAGFALFAPDAPHPEAAELLQQDALSATLDQLEDDSGADLLLIDLPPVLEQDDTLGFLPVADALILVADGQSSTAADLRACETRIGNKAEIAGVILNRVS